MLIENMGSETSVCTQNLPCHRPPHRIILFRHESDMIPLRVQYDIFVRLLEPKHNVHKLQLPLYNDARVGQDVGRRMLFSEDAIWIFWDMDGR